MNSILDSLSNKEVYYIKEYCKNHKNPFADKNNYRHILPVDWIESDYNSYERV